MADMNFEPCKADTYQWMIPEARSDRTLYCQFVLLYTYNTLSIMEDKERFLCKELVTRFTLKEKLISPPTKYIGNKVSQVTLGNGKKCWDFRSSHYIQNEMNNVE